MFKVLRPDVLESGCPMAQIILSEGSPGGLLATYNVPKLTSTSHIDGIQEMSPVYQPRGQRLLPHGNNIHLK